MVAFLVFMIAILAIVFGRKKLMDAKGLFARHTYIYLHPKISNEAVFGHRQPRLVTYAT